MSSAGAHATSSMALAPPRADLRAWRDGLLGILIFSASLPATRVALTGYDAWFLTSARAAIAGVIAGAVLLALPARRPSRGDLVPLAICTGAKKRAISGNPDTAHVSTSFVERQNLTIRMHMRRLTRLTNGFSKKVENHMHAVALHAMCYNFVKEQRGLRMRPAMAADVTDTLWTIDNIVRIVELYDTKPGKRGPYRKADYS